MSALPVVAQGLSVAYSASPALLRAHMQVPAGVVMGVLGPNGCGKSTLLKAMLGLVPTLEGHTLFFGQPLRAVRAKVGYMPQHTSVDWDFPTTVSEVVLMGTYGSLGWLRRPGPKQHTAAEEAMEQVGITDLARRQIGQLSGGQRQRVFLARTLAGRPELFLMDEPFQGVDAHSQQAIVSVLHQLRNTGSTVVMVHHDLSTVSYYCDQVTFLRAGQVLASGATPETFTRENIERVFGPQLSLLT